MANETNIPLLNGMRSMPAVFFDRSIDRIPDVTGSGGGGGTPFIPPLWLSKVDDSNVIVSAGTVGGLVPTGVATNLDVSGTDGTWNIFITAGLNAAGDVTGASINGNTTTVPADDSSTAYYLIGNVVVASSIITSVSPTLAWSQEFAACGRDPADPGTTPGTYYFFVA